MSKGPIRTGPDRPGPKVLSTAIQENFVYAISVPESKYLATSIFIAEN
jgi:hypothetical protein